jgi:phage tail-like protein
MADDNTPIPGGYYPPVGFHFSVFFSGISAEGDNDTRFQSVSGLTMEYDTESIKEGGENRFEHKLPGRTKYPDLSLKRGMLTNSNVINWVKNALQNREFKPIQIIVKLLNEEHQPLKTWNIMNAWPKKWAVSDFNAQENAIVVETLDISYSFFTTQ